SPGEEAKEAATAPAASPPPAKASTHQDPVAAAEPSPSDSGVRGVPDRAPSLSGAAALIKSDANETKDLGKPGWISIPNSGKLPGDRTEPASGGPQSAGDEAGSKEAPTASDLRAHASRDVAFEPEPSQASGSRRAALNGSASLDAAGSSHTKAAQAHAAS